MPARPEKAARSPAAEPAVCRLYLVSPPRFEVPAFSRALEQALGAGDVACFQLRMKDAKASDIVAAARALMPICHGHDVAFIVNDDPEIAARLGADGVHVGQEDAGYADARHAVGRGGIVGVIGPNGAGKTTLFRMIVGEDKPDDGAILIDERDIRHFSANELRSHYGVVPQETMLFSGTIYDNLALANPHATFEQVIQACKLAEIHDTIEKLPEGYQTAIGEHGVGLSGGQKQRIAIARALLKRPKILIFDEATSSLDEATAESFGNTVNRLKGKVSMLFITHQLPRNLKVDHLVRLDGPSAEGRSP